MEAAFKTGKKVRSRIGRIAAAVGLALMICSVAAGPARADDHDRGRGHDDRGHHDDHDRGWGGGTVYVAPGPYYAPDPDYYAAPEPYEYYPPEPQPDYYPPPPPEGINLFFGR